MPATLISSLNTSRFYPLRRHLILALAVASRLSFSDSGVAQTTGPLAETHAATSATRSGVNGLPPAEPETVGLDPKKLARIDELAETAIADGRMPGCVIAIGRHGQIAWLKAYGQKRVEPHQEPMSVDTVFDLASITKPMATATSVMILVEQGKVRLRDKLSEHFAGFEQGGKQAITVEHLLTHQSGLTADNPISDYDHGPEEAWKRILESSVSYEPGSQFVYSDVGFIVLGELIRRVSGMDVSEFSQQHVFQPLGMQETGFLIGPELRQRAAPTEMRDQQWIQGEVHDPRAHRLGGVAGHAGLFSTAADVAIYAQMLLQQGRYREQTIMSAAAIERMTQPFAIQTTLRGLGWDKQSAYSSNRGEFFSSAAFGHGGFTGTVLWIDPHYDLFFIFLSNRVHPNGQGNVNSLAGRMATIIVSAIDDRREAAKSDGNR